MTQKAVAQASNPPQPLPPVVTIVTIGAGDMIAAMMTDTEEVAGIMVIELAIEARAGAEAETAIERGPELW